ncbi:MAG: hypothetical protein ACE15C_11480 [Phycisphaerae bacterium]
MPTVTCPICRDTLKKGSWEIFTHCPSCGAEWPVDPDEPRRIKQKIITLAWTYAVLAFVPALGVIFGAMAVFWGYMAAKTRRALAGTVVMIIGMVVGIAGQPVLTYWGVGYLQDRACMADLQTLANSIYAYGQLTGQYPADLKTLENLRLPVPSRCAWGSGGPYYYRSPSASTQPTTCSRPATAASGSGGTLMAETAPVTPTPAPRPRTTELVGPRPATRQATQPTTAPAPDVFQKFGNDRTLMVAEVARGHRYLRMCITTDDVVRSMPHKEFDKLLEEPQNRAFAIGLGDAWRASTQPAAKQTSAPASSPATSQAATSQSASSRSSGPETSSRPATSAAATKPDSG